MTFVPMVPVAVIVLLVVAYAVLLWLGARWIRHGGAEPGAWRRWWRMKQSTGTHADFTIIGHNHDQTV